MGLCLAALGSENMGNCCDAEGNENVNKND